MDALSPHKISEALYNFEKDNKELILSNEIEGFIAWQLLRKSLYYRFKNKNYVFNSEKKRTPLLKHAYEGMVYFWKALRFSVLRSRSLLVVTNVNYKLAKNEAGAYTDIFVDHFLNNHYRGNFIYIEASKSKAYKENVSIKKDIKDFGKHIFLKLTGRFFVKKQKAATIADKFTSTLNGYFQKNELPLTVKKADILEILVRFQSEFLFFRFMLQLIKPKAVFFVDGIPDGAMAAARRLGIKTFDFQHGFIIKDKADYILSDYLQSVKDKIVVPDYLLVFGDFFKDIVLKSGFWNKDSIIPVGNYRVAEIRKNFVKQEKVNDPSTQTKVLLATQVTTFNYTKPFLLEVVKNLPANVLITIKCHGREPAENNLWYQSLAKQYPQQIAYVKAEESLVDLMASHDILASYHSTAIFEALGLGLPVITIGTPEYPSGTNSLIEIDIKEVLREAASPQDFVQLLTDFAHKACFKNEWLESCRKQKHFFYAEDYDANLEKLDQLIQQ